MPQASIYLDAPTLTMAKQQAKERNVSLSKHLSNLITSYHARTEWPKTFLNTFGALADSDFHAPERPSWDEDNRQQEIWGQ